MLDPSRVQEAAFDMLAVIEAVEWAGGYEDVYGHATAVCPSCSAEVATPHTDDCILWLALRKAGAR